MKKIVFLIISFIAPFLVQANDYQKAWEAISNKDLKTAKTLLESARKDPAYTVDANMTLILLESFEGTSENISTVFDKVYESSPNPYPYMYATWFFEAVAGPYGKKTKEQLKRLQKIQKDPQCNGTLKAAAYYSEGMHYLKSNDFKMHKKKFEFIGGLRGWQFVGPFENTLGSGFDKNYPPIAEPQKHASFTSKDNYQIAWFKPPQVEPESWLFVKRYVHDYNAIAYAQTFVYSETDQDVLICAGITGSLKLWVNDQLVIKEEKEVVTEMDTYKNRVRLKKGYNRILAQIGFSTTGNPNFMVRITDEKYNNIPKLVESSSYQDYPKVGGDISDKTISLFAEDFFKEKIEKDPSNPINYILLSKTYLRSAQENKARAIIDKCLALPSYADNALLRTELIIVYLALENRSSVLSEIDWIKQNLPNNYYPLTVELSELYKNEKYNEAEAVLQKIITAYGKNELTYLYEIRLAQAQGQTEKLLNLIKESYKKYPDNVTFAAFQYRVEKEMNNKAAQAIKVLENFCKSTYDHDMVSGLIDEYRNQGNAEGMLDLLNKLHEGFPYEAAFMRELALFYYLIQRYDMAIKYMEEALAQQPYNSEVWNGLGVIYEQKHEDKKAIESFEVSLDYDGNQYDLRHKLNKLKGQQNLTEYLPKQDEYEYIKKTELTDAKKGRDWYYIFYKTNKILFPKGACEEHHSLAIKIINKQGIDYWKSLDLGYDHYRQKLVIEKAEVIKKNGRKIEAERNQSALVFTDLELEDVVYIKYKIENYNYGRFAQDFWDKFTFNAFMHTDYSSYCLLVPKDLKFEYKMQNSDLQPKIEEFGNYLRYSWVMENLPPLESEALMPTINDIGMNLHISTIKNWNEVAEWYSAISKTQAKIDYDLQQLLKEILPSGQNFSDIEKARRIYNYIVKNINYSSISFRQSAYVPQKPSKTFQTKLGDCKDVSTLFATLGREAGLDVNLVLVDTRDNGLNTMLLPSLNFNHCIVRLNLADGPKYLELTNPDLPFGSITSSLLDATILDIPFDITKVEKTPELTALKKTTRTPNKIYRYQTISISGKDLLVKSKTTRVGSYGSYTRGTYLNLDEKLQKESMRDAINSDFQNPIELLSLSFEKLDELNDTLNYSYDYKAKNEVINIGGMQTFKIPFTDLAISPDVFAKENRVNPIDYDTEMDGSYEEVTVLLDEGKSFVEIPQNVSLESKGIKFKITYNKIADNKLHITKEYIPLRKQFDVADYKELKEFFNTIIASEGQYLGFK